MMQTPEPGDDPAPAWRIASRGRCYAYLLPSRDEDVVKVGFSRDPLQRLRALHVRYFDFFDLDRGALVEFEHVRDARALEAQLKRSLADAATWAPLVIRSAAGGRTEWFRGVSNRAHAAMADHAQAAGFVLHANLREWLHDRLVSHADALFDTSLHAWRAIDYIEHNGDARSARLQERALRNALDAYAAVGVELDTRLEGTVLEWYRRGSR